MKLLGLILGLVCVLGHESHDHVDKGYETFEDINERAFFKRVVSRNVTSVNGKTVKFMITESGHWHLDACSVVGHNDIGFVGAYRRSLLNKDEGEARRLNPFDAGGTAPDYVGDWLLGVVYYEIEHPNLNMDKWNTAMQQYAAETPIRLVQIPESLKASQQWLRVIRGSGCWSWIGKLPKSGQFVNGQELSLGDGCDDYLPTIMHEIGHALGFYHTQARDDRDDFVTINFNFVLQDARDQYDKSSGTPVCGVYDTTSMMHYGSTTFRDFNACQAAGLNSNNCFTIVSNDPANVIGRDSNNPLSDNDIFCLCNLYEPQVNGQDSPSCDGSNATPYPTKSPTIRPTKAPIPSGPIPPPTKSPSKSPTTRPTLQPTISPVPTVAGAAGFCIRGPESTFFNGFYQLQPNEDSNGNQYYKKQETCGSVSPQYAYYHEYCRYYINNECQTLLQTWRIYETLGETNWYHAICDDADIFNCNGKWKVNSILTTTVHINGPCPGVGCSTVTVEGTAGCDGNYALGNGQDFVFRNTAISRTLEYNERRSWWICYPTNRENYLLGTCLIYDWTDSYFYPLEKSVSGVFPELTSIQTSIGWGSGEGSTATLKCTGTDNVPAPTPPPIAPAHDAIYCSELVTTSVTANGESISYDFVIPDGYYAIVFSTCYPETTADVQLTFSLPNLVDTIPTDDYTQTFCSNNLGKAVAVVWKVHGDWSWTIGETYTVTVKGMSNGNVKMAAWCQASQASALNFGTNNGEYVPIFSFKAYGPVQWTLFFGILIAIILLNVVGCYFIVKYTIKRKQAELEKNLNQTGQSNQNNIQMIAADIDDYENDGQYPTGAT